MVISVKNLSFSYHDQQKLLEDISFTAEKGQFISIIGPNGSGKSTLLKVMLQLRKAQTGHVSIDGQDLAKMSIKQRAKLYAFLPQAPEVHEDISVREFVFLGRFHNKHWFKDWSDQDRQLVDQAIEWVGLSDFKQTSILELSGGQRQRAFIAMILAQDTDYIFLDEPTSYLDINHQIEFIELLKRLQLELGKTIVIVLHDISLVAKYSDYVVTVENGHLHSTGTPLEVFTPDMLHQVFSIQAQICPLANCQQVLCYDFQKAKEL